MAASDRPHRTERQPDHRLRLPAVGDDAGAAHAPQPPEHLGRARDAVPDARPTAGVSTSATSEEKKNRRRLADRTSRGDAASASSSSTARRRSPRSSPGRRRSAPRPESSSEPTRASSAPCAGARSSPSYHRDLAAIRRMFPDAHFVHVVRDPRSAVASLKRMPWWKRSTHASVATWAQATRPRPGGQAPLARARCTRSSTSACSPTRRASSGRSAPRSARSSIPSMLSRTVSRMRFRLGRTGRRARGSRSRPRRSRSGRTSSSRGRSRSARRCFGAGWRATATSFRCGPRRRQGHRSVRLGVPADEEQSAGRPTARDRRRVPSEPNPVAARLTSTSVQRGSAACREAVGRSATQTVSSPPR